MTRRASKISYAPNLHRAVGKKEKNVEYRNLLPSDSSRLLGHGEENMKQDIFNAIVAKDARGLAASLLAMPSVSDIFFSPLDPDCPDPTFAGSLVGLCASLRWHDGLRICRDCMINPNRNSDGAEWNAKPNAVPVAACEGPEVKLFTSLSIPTRQY
jgi:hypothetical protein